MAAQWLLWHAATDAGGMLDRELQVVVRRMLQADWSDQAGCTEMGNVLLGYGVNALLDNVIMLWQPSPLVRTHRLPGTGCLWLRWRGEGSGKTAVRWR